MAKAPAAATGVTAEALGPRRLAGTVVRLAWPVVVQQLGMTLVQLVDTFLVGHLGAPSLAGVGLASMLYWFPMAGAFAVGMGATAVVARQVGAGHPEQSSRSLQQALRLAFLWGVALSVLFWALASLLMQAMGATPEVVELGAAYMRASVIGLTFASLLQAGNACLVATGDTRTPMVVILLVNAVNGVMAYLLINGVGPFPQLGVVGSGLGYTLGNIVGVLVILGLLARGHRGLRFRPRSILRWDSQESGRILQVGLPAGIEQLQFQLAFTVYTRIISGLGTTAIAAHQVALRVENLAFMPGMAFNVATMALVGQALGMGRPDLAQRVTVLASRYAALSMTAIGVALIFLGAHITRLFIDDAEVIELGRRLMFIFAFAMPGFGIMNTVSGALRGAGDTRSVLVIQGLGVWGLRLFPAHVLANLVGLGAPGAWMAAVMDITIRSLLTIARFRQGKWKTIKP